MQTAIGTVRDVQPGKERPWLRLYFEAELARDCHWAHGKPVGLKLDDGPPWRGAVAMPPSRTPCLLTRVRRGGEEARLTDILLAMGLAPGATLEFELKGPTQLKLLWILDMGTWPPGQAPEERAAPPPETTPPETTPPETAPPEPERAPAPARTKSARPAPPSEPEPEPEPPAPPPVVAAPPPPEAPPRSPVERLRAAERALEQSVRRWTRRQARRGHRQTEMVPDGRAPGVAAPADAPAPEEHAPDAAPPIDQAPAVPAAFPLDDAAAVKGYAERYRALIGEAGRELEATLELRLPGCRARGELDWPVFLSICAWHDARRYGECAANAEAEVRRATSQAFTAEDPEAAIAALCALKGVDLATASALLFWMRPDEHPLVVGATARPLGETPPDGAAGDLALYRRIAERISAAARDLGLDLPTLVRALAAWDRQHNARA